MSHVAATNQHMLLVEELCDYSLQLMRTLRQEALRAFEPLGIRPLQALVLELVAHEVRHPKDLADALDLVPPAVSTLLAELEGRGLIVRQIDPNDRRRVQLTLTPDGESMREEIKDAWFNHSAKLLDKLSPEDIGALITVYRKLIEPA